MKSGGKRGALRLTARFNAPVSTAFNFLNLHTYYTTDPPKKLHVLLQPDSARGGSKR